MRNFTHFVLKYRLLFPTKELRYFTVIPSSKEATERQKKFKYEIQTTEQVQHTFTGQEASEFLDLLRMHFRWEVGKSSNSSLYVGIYHNFPCLVARFVSPFRLPLSLSSTESFLTWDWVKSKHLITWQPLFTAGKAFEEHHTNFLCYWFCETDQMKKKLWAVKK